MKVKAILPRRPGGGRRRGPGAPAAGRGSATWPSTLRGPAAPWAVRGLEELTGSPRPQPGRERQAALRAAVGPSDRPGVPTLPSARSSAGPPASRRPPPRTGAVLMWGLGREAPNRAPAGKARALEPRPGARAAEPPRPGPQRARLGASLLLSRSSGGWEA